MMPKNVLGIVYSNSYDSCLGALTARRTMGSVPFGGRYRLVDFPLSSMVNCGITKVGVITNSHYRSLMDHIGSGRPWDLSRKVDGLTLLPPFDINESNANTRIELLTRISDFISKAKQEYVLLMDSNFVCNLDLSKFMDFFSEKKADIGICYCDGKVPNLEDQVVIDSVGEDGRIKNLNFSVQNSDEDHKYLVRVVLIRKALLERLIGDAKNFPYTTLDNHLFLKNVEFLKVYGYKIEEWNTTIDSMNSFFKANMALLERNVRNELFNDDNPIYTKVRNDMPVVYGINSNCQNSLLADGCQIEGTVKNCVLFRGARVAKGAVVENSILMQDAFVGEDTKLNCVIMDKKTVISPKKNLSGDEKFPLYVGKGIVI